MAVRPSHAALPRTRPCGRLDPWSPPSSGRPSPSPPLANGPPDRTLALPSRPISPSPRSSLSSLSSVCSPPPLLHRLPFPHSSPCNLIDRRARLRAASIVSARRAAPACRGAAASPVGTGLSLGARSGARRRLRLRPASPPSLHHRALRNVHSTLKRVLRRIGDFSERGHPRGSEFAREGRAVAAPRAATAERPLSLGGGERGQSRGERGAGREGEEACANSRPTAEMGHAPGRRPARRALRWPWPSNAGAAWKDTDDCEATAWACQLRPRGAHRARARDMAGARRERRPGREEEGEGEVGGRGAVQGGRGQGHLARVGPRARGREEGWPAGRVRGVTFSVRRRWRCFDFSTPAHDRPAPRAALDRCSIGAKSRKGSLFPSSLFI